MTEPEKHKVGKAAYDAYAKAVGGKSFNDEPLLHYEALPENIRSAWNEAGVAAHYVDIPSEHSDW